MPRRRTGQIEARIAAKAQSNRFAHGAGSSQSIRKICNEELTHFNQQLLIHELIKDSLKLTCRYETRAEVISGIGYELPLSRSQLIPCNPLPRADHWRLPPALRLPSRKTLSSSIAGRIAALLATAD